MYISATILFGLCLGLWYNVFSDRKIAKLISPGDVLRAILLVRVSNKDLEKQDFVHVTLGAVFLTLLLIVFVICRLIN